MATQEQAFDAARAAESARAKIGGRAATVEAQLRDEVAARERAVAEYAAHLERGGDPREHPKDGFSWHESRSALIAPSLGLDAVYEAWNEARGGLHDFSPVRDKARWSVAEVFAASVGEPLTFEALKGVWRSAVFSSCSSDEIAKVAWRFEGERFAARRTKVGGRVAFLVRERREGDPDLSEAAVSRMPTE